MHRFSLWDRTLIGGFALLVLVSLVIVVFQPGIGERLLALRTLHYWLSRAALAIALVMLGLAVYIGLIRHKDVTSQFRRTTYGIVAFMVLESLVGLTMYAFIGVRPYEEVHLIYGLGAMLSLPFFIYVESTAKKRPAMGSYIWGFALLAAIIVRLYMTGARG